MFTNQKRKEKKKEKKKEKRKNDDRKAKNASLRIFFLFLFWLEKIFNERKR
jgi:hypothetical protein